MTAAENLPPEQHPLITSQENPAAMLAQFRLLAPQRFNKRSLHALVVEDQPFSRKMLHDALRDFCTVDPAKDAHEGVKAYLKYPPHIAFLDIGLPDGSGHAMAALLRQLDPEAFIVMVTGNNSSDGQRRRRLYCQAVQQAEGDGLPGKILLAPQRCVGALQNHRGGGGLGATLISSATAFSEVSLAS